MSLRISFILGFLLVTSFIFPNNSFAYGIKNPIYTTTYSNSNPNCNVSYSPQRPMTQGYSVQNPIHVTSYANNNPIHRPAYSPPTAMAAGYSPISTETKYVPKKLNHLPSLFVKR